MRPLLVYTAARLAVLVVALGLTYLAGARGWLWLLLSLLVYGLSSYLLLRRQRDAVAGALSTRVQTVRARMQERTRAEDEADEEDRRQQQGRDRPGGRDEGPG